MNAGLRRKLFIISIVLIVVVLLVYGFLPGAQQIDLVKVVRGPLQITIEEEGRTRLKERFTISAPTAGYMRRINAKVGDPVKKGQMSPLWSLCSHRLLIPGVARRRKPPFPQLKLRLKPQQKESE